MASVRRISMAVIFLLVPIAVCFASDKNDEDGYVLVQKEDEPDRIETPESEGSRITVKGRSSFSSSVDPVSNELKENMEAAEELLNNPDLINPIPTPPLAIPPIPDQPLLPNRLDDPQWPEPFPKKEFWHIVSPHLWPILLFTAITIYCHQPWFHPLSYFSTSQHAKGPYLLTTE